MVKKLNNINYQKWLDNTLEQITRQNNTPTLLLHSCCAPCSSYVIEYLSQYFSITVFYYNPNISPDSEYQYRVSEQKRLISLMSVRNTVSFLEGNYTPTEFYHVCKGLEKEKEGGKRCEQCFRLRLSETAEKAKELSFDYFTTTLTISPLKNASLINAIGKELSEQYGVAYLYSDFKKKEGYKRSIVLSREYQLYRQNYCGCVFSKSQ